MAAFHEVKRGFML